MQTALSLFAIALGGYGPIYLIMYFLFRWKYKTKLSASSIVFSGVLGYITGVIVLTIIPLNTMPMDYRQGVSLLVFVLTTAGFISWFMNKDGEKLGNEI